MLAAGASHRLGQPKQLLQYEGKSLLKHVLQVALQSETGPVTVVLGANAELISKEADGIEVDLLINKDWQVGMSSSIRFGLQVLLGKRPSIDAVIFMMCDQPYVSAELIRNLVNAQRQTGKPIVASGYDEVFGPPALFYKSFFPDLMKLEGDAGARKIIQLNGKEVATVSFPQGRIDIDTVADYEAIKKN